MRVRATGLCGSDLHYYQHGRNGDFALCHPMCLGHESAGEVVAVGPGAAGRFAPGDRVAIEAGVWCGTCALCQGGRYNLCPGLRFASSAKTTPHLDGTLQRLLNWPARLLHPIPAGVSMTAAALVEPLSVVLHALRRARFQPGHSVLVLGAGAVGLLACAAAKAAGASYVAAVDINQGRLDFARDNQWADDTFLLTGAAAAGADPIATARETAAALLAKLGRSTAPFDRTFECTGVPACVQTSIFATAPGGATVLIGMGTPIQTLPIGAAALREVDIIGVFRYANTYPTALAMLSSGALKAAGDGRHATAPATATATPATGRGGIENLVSHTFPLEKADLAFQTLANGRDAEFGRGVVKVFITDEQP